MPKEAERRVTRCSKRGSMPYRPDRARRASAYDLYLPGGVLYVRKPIPDHGVRGRGNTCRNPAELDARWREGAGVRALSRRNWRTGTVIGCHLVEQGLTADAALIRLNELWQGNDLAATWPDIPETEDSMPTSVRGRRP